MSLVGIPQLAAALFPLKEDVFFTFEIRSKGSDRIIINHTSDDSNADEDLQGTGEKVIYYDDVSKIFARLVIRLDVCRENLFSDDRPNAASIYALTVSVDNSAPESTPPLLDAYAADGNSEHGD